MTKANIYILLIVLGWFLLLAKTDDTPQCFQYTWVAPIFDSKPDRYNCSLYKGIPCIEPLIRSGTPPDTNELWISKNYSMLCNVTSGNVCIKYTFTYNDQKVNTSLFCGKAIEDKIIPITSGCYEQRVDGFLVEMCACQPRRGKEPCNMSTNIKYSITSIITALLISFISLIYY